MTAALQQCEVKWGPVSVPNMVGTVTGLARPSPGQCLGLVPRESPDHVSPAEEHPTYKFRLSREEHCESSDERIRLAGRDKSSEVAVVRSLKRDEPAALISDITTILQTQHH
jgi:hypothetical protein